ncbi:MAG: choice-of-anchor J domain-containing protein [Candidatus Cloacimonetes bacterium]|nr:choice-of-anchor J domain-containing protein [Candidatus Cloacimonadota bacterium]
MSTLDINYDGFKVYLSSAVPSNDSYPSGEQIGDNWYGSSTSWQEVNIAIDGSYAGTTRYLIFTWRNDGDAPKALGALDNISLATDYGKPDPPESLSASTIDMSSINLNWQKNANNNDVLIAVNNTGSFSNPLDNQSYTVGSTLGCGSEIIYIGSATSFLHSGLSPESTYYYKAWSVNQVNMYSTGISTQGSTASLPISTFPFNENFEADSPHLSKWTQIAETGSNLWTIATGSSGGSITAAHSGTYNARFTSSSGGPHITKLLSPVFDFTGIAEAELAFWYAQEVWSGNQNELKVYYRTSPGTAWEQLAHYTENIAVWTQVRMNLPNLSSTYQIAFEGIDNYGWDNVLDDITIREVVSEPVLYITPDVLNFPYLEVGDTAEHSFAISNIGGGDLVLDQQPGLIGADASQYQLIDTNRYPLTITFENPASYTVRYLPTISGAHSAQVSISYDVGHVVDLSGRAGYLIFGDDFEAHTDFTLDLSPWTQQDGDGSVTYGINTVDFLNEHYTGSYIAFNPSATTPALGEAWAAQSGAKYAAAFAASTPPNNDWLISPQINFGDNPVISFWARSPISQYDQERFKVLYSTTGNNYTDFTNYLAGSALEYVVAPTSWTQYVYDLPVGLANSSVYIAIQCVSNDAFVFMVDDFKAFSGSPPAPIISVSPDPYDYPDFFPNYSRYQEFTITNAGNAELQINESGSSLAVTPSSALNSCLPFLLC